MVCKLLKKVISLAVAFAVVLSLSCCGVGDEVLIDEIDTETTAETEAAAEETTEELTTLETTIEEVTETTIEETSLTIPDEETILASLTDEEKEVWFSMPDIVTMRMLKRRDEDDNFLYTEIIYIDKMGQIKKFISLDKPDPNDTNESIKWLNDSISNTKDAKLVDLADIHTLIEFYINFIRIDKDSTSYLRYTRTLGEYIERHYWFELYGTRNDGKNVFETIQIAYGNAGIYYLRRNNTNEGEPLDKTGGETFDLYLKLEPFMVDIPGGIGHLTGEEG